MILKTHRSATFTIPYRRWYRDMVQICEIQQLPFWMEWVLPQPGDHLGVRSVPPLEIVSGLQSRDSRLIRRRVIVSHSSKTGMYS